MNQIAIHDVEPAGLIPEELLARFAEQSAARDNARELPYEAVTALKAARLGAVRLPLAAGGVAASLEQSLAAALKLATADSNIAHIWRNHFMLVDRLALRPGANPVLQQLRREVADGALIGLAGAEAGRPQGGPGASSSAVVRTGAGYRFSARKMYSTGSIFADWIVTYGELEDGTRVNIVVPRGRKGIELIDDWDGMGQRLTGTGTTIFDDVELSSDELIRPTDLHPQAMFVSSTIAQLFLTTVIAGIVAAVARDAAEVLGSRDRTFYFAPTLQAREDPLLLASLGERQADAFAAEAIVLAAARVLDRAADAVTRGGEAADEAQASALAAAKAKVAVDAIGQRAASALYDVAGASATLRSRNLDRHWRNLRTVASHNPASYKALAIGAHFLNGTPLPSQGFF